jgi:metal-dependent amidase/aminoacylase/carboxypeptidase family protein
MASVVNCFGQHVNTKFSANQIRYSPGPCKAHCDFWEVIVKGSGGHAMAPEDTKDAL